SAGCRAECAGRCLRRGRRRTGCAWSLGPARIGARRSLERGTVRKPPHGRRPPRAQPYSGNGGRQVRSVSDRTTEADPSPTAPAGQEELEVSGQPAPAAPEPVKTVVPRWVQLVLLPLSLLALWALARAAGKVLLIFIVAAVIALILNPAVAFIQRGRVPRGLAVLTVYLAFFLTLVGIGFLLANPISNHAQSFANNLPHIVNEANRTLANFQRELNDNGVHVHFINQGKTALQSLQDKLVKSSSKLVSFGGGLLTEAVSASIDLVLVFVLSVYM